MDKVHGFVAQTSGTIRVGDMLGGGDWGARACLFEKRTGREELWPPLVHDLVVPLDEYYGGLRLLECIWCVLTMSRRRFFVGKALDGDFMQFNMSVFKGLS